MKGLIPMVFSRVFTRGHVVSRQAAVAALTVALLVTSLSMSRHDARAQEFNAPSVAGDHAEVIAQGVAPFSSSELAWRLVEDTAEPLGEAAFEERALGFAVATEGALLLTEDPTGARTRLAPGEAAFTAEGAVQARESLEDTGSSYLRIGLVDVAEADNGNGDEVLFSGSAFTGPEGEYEVELVGVKLDEDESTSVKSDYPMLVVATEGDVSIGDAVLTEGTATVIETQADLLAEDGAARVLVALVGSPVPAGAEITADDDATPVAGDSDGAAGRIVVLTELCPVEVTYEQAQDLTNGDPCVGGGPVEEMQVQITNTETGESFNDGVDPANSTAYFDGLPAGNYDVLFATGASRGETLGVCGGQDRSADLQPVTFIANEVNLELPANREYLCVTRTLQLGDEDAVITEGVVEATFYACPDGMTFETLDSSQCEVVTEGFDFGFQGDVDHVDLHLADATLAEGTFLWTGLTIYPDLTSSVSYSPIVFFFPPGYDAYGISTDGGEILLPHAGGYGITDQHQSFTLAVYFFSS
jgi:hypothetical protein